MKKSMKKYFIISSILQILMGATLIIFAKDLSKYFINVISFFSSEKTATTIAGIAYILLNLEVLVMLFKKNNNLAKKKSEIIFEYFTIIILGLSPINIILSIISIVTMIKNVENIKNKSNTFKVTDKDLPKLKNMNLSNSKLLIGAFLLLSYMFSEYWWSRIPILFSSTIDEVILDAVYIILCIFVFVKPFIRDLKEYVSNFRVYVKYTAYKFIIFTVMFIPLAMLVGYLTNNAQSLNQIGLEKMPLIYIIPSTIIVAPIVEEILCRGIIRKIFKNKILFIIISSILFGLMHTNWEPTLYLVFIQGIPYMLMGLLFSYLYVKTDNILISISMHMLLNIIASIGMITGL